MAYQLESKSFLIGLLLLFSYESFAVYSLTNGMDQASQTVLHVLAVVPESNYGQINTQLHPKWIDGNSILPSIYLAESEISNKSNFLQGYQLKIVPIRVALCDIIEGFYQVTKELILKDNVIGAVGFYCNGVADHISELVAHQELSLIQISAKSNSNYQEDKSDSGLSHTRHVILSYSQSLVRAVINLLLRLKWNRVAVISSQQFDSYVDQHRLFLELAKQWNIDVSLTMELSDFSYRFESPKNFLKDLQNVGVKIIVAFLSPFELVDMLCSAYLNGFTWPSYAWIFTEGVMSETKFSKYCTDDTYLNAINNAFFLSLQTRTTKDDNLLPSGSSYSSFFEAYLELLNQSSQQLSYDLQSYQYANVLYDSIWAVALTVNRSLSELNEKNLSLSNLGQARGKIFDVLEKQLSDLSFQGTTGFLNFSSTDAAVESTVYILQFQNNQQVLVGSYDLSYDRLRLNATKLGNIPSDMLEQVFIVYPTWLTAILAALIAICFSLTTVCMYLFFHYRQQPAIKASSYLLSFCMFVGCYLLLTSSLFHTITSSIVRKEALKEFNCMFDIYLIAIGLDIVLATIIAKTLRIYYIFHKFGKVSRIFSDSGLFVFILLIIFVRIILLILWTTLDISTVVDVKHFISKTVPPFYVVSEQCNAKHIGIWLSLHFGYSALLMLIMVLLAVMTRKIKRQHFKDSKSINMLVLALVFDLWILMPLWIVLRSVGAIIPSRLSYCFGPLIASLLCQMFLIWPKTLPLMLQSCKCVDISWARFYNKFTSHNDKSIATERGTK